MQSQNFTHCPGAGRPSWGLRPVAAACALAAGARPGGGGFCCGGQGNHRRHRHPPRHRVVDRHQARLRRHRRGHFIGRHRQAARRQHCRVAGPPARPDRPARQRRPRQRHLHPRPVAGVLGRAAQRPRDREFERRPRRGVRPVPVRAHRLGHGLQDTQRQPHRPRPVGHGGPDVAASAGLARTRDGLEPARRTQLAGHPGTRRGQPHRQAPELLFCRPVRRQHRGPGGGLCAARVHDPVARHRAGPVRRLRGL